MPDDMIWRVDREAVLALGSGRALLMQAAHPLAAAAIGRSVDRREDPRDRLLQTMDAVWTVVYGSREDADRVARRVRSMHTQVNGHIPERMGPFPAGTPYSALDPELLLWAHVTLVDTMLSVYESWVRRLDCAEREAFYQDAALVGRIFGTPDNAIPATYADFRAYMDERLASDEICVTDAARELADWVLQPPSPLRPRPAWRWFNFATVALLPSRLREQYGFSWNAGHRLLFDSSRLAIRRVALPLLPDRRRAIAPARAAEFAIREGRSRSGLVANHNAGLRPLATGGRFGS